MEFLIKVTLSKDNKVVVVVTGGITIEVKESSEIADAVVMAWYPGQEGGYALGDLLFGDVKFSGRLPMTFPIDVADHYASQNMVMNAPNITRGVGQKDEDQCIRNIDYTI